MWAALKIAKREGPGKKFVVVLPDSVRNYMTKFMDDRWMKENGFTEPSWGSQSVDEILRRMPQRQLHTADGSESVADGVMRMKEQGISQLPILDGSRLVGIVTESDLLAGLVEGRTTLASSIAEVMFRNVETVHLNDDASVLLDCFARGYVGLAVDGDGQLVGILTKMDLVEHLAAPIQ
jgi:cystathionine beta-synthase